MVLSTSFSSWLRWQSLLVIDFRNKQTTRFLNLKVAAWTYTQNFESDSPRHCSRKKWFKYQVNLNSVFLWRTYKLECCVCRVVLHRRREGLPTKRRSAGWHMYQGVVHTSLRLRSRIYNNTLVERWQRLLFRACNFSHSKQASTQHRDAFGRESEVI